MKFKNLKLFVKEINKIKNPIRIELHLLLSNIPFLTIFYLMLCFRPEIHLEYKLLWSIMIFEIICMLIAKERDKK